MVLHIGIANEMEIHSSVLPISRYAKIPQTQKAEQPRLPSSSFDAWRASEIKGGSFVYWRERFTLFNTLAPLKTSAYDALCVYIFFIAVVNGQRLTMWLMVNMTRWKMSIDCFEYKVILIDFLLLQWGLKAENASSDQQQIISLCQFQQFLFLDYFSPTSNKSQRLL